MHTQTESQCTETHSQGVASTLDPLTENENAPIADRSSLGQTLLELLHIQNISATRWSVFRALDHETGLSAVELYDSMAVALPCALRPDIGLETLLNGRPFFLLAVIVTATSSQPGLQTEAEEVFRHALAGKAIIEGQRSMEILQGLLTYLLWYQHCFNQQTQQYYQYLSLALGMMADLGLHKFEVNIGQGTSQACHINQARTLLLCYYLSCGASVLAFDRPESMQCIGSVRKAATILSDVKERAVDQASPALVEILYIAAQVHGSFHTENCTHGSVPAGEVPVLLERWKVRYFHGCNCQCLVSTYHFVAGYLQMKMMRHNRLDRDSVLHGITACVSSFRSLLDNILDQPARYLHDMSIVEWAQLFIVIIIMPRVERRAGILHAQMTLTYIERLARRVNELRSLENDRYNAKISFFWLEKVLTDTRDRARSTEMADGRVPEDESSGYELVQAVAERATVADTPQEKCTEQSHDLKNATERGQQSRAQQLDQSTTEETFWAEIMSNWLNWN